MIRWRYACACAMEAMLVPEGWLKYWLRDGCRIISAFVRHENRLKFYGRHVLSPSQSPRPHDPHTPSQSATEHKLSRARVTDIYDDEFFILNYHCYTATITVTYILTSHLDNINLLFPETMASQMASGRCWNRSGACRRSLEIRPQALRRLLLKTGCIL